MASLKQLLDELEIDVDVDKEKEDDQIDFSKIEIDKLPEEHQKAFKVAIDTIETLKTDIAKRDLMLEGMKTAIASVPKKNDQDKDDGSTKKEKVLGVIDPDDPYAPAFKSIADSINEIKTFVTKGSEKDFKSELISFAQNHKDIARYAKDMDILVEEHPTLKNDIPKLYTLAKSINEGRDKLVKQKKEENKNVREFVTERSGVFQGDVVSNVQSKTIQEAFEKSISSLSGGNK